MIPLDAEGRWVTLHYHERRVAIEEGLVVPYVIERGGTMHEVYVTDRVCELYQEKYQARNLADDILAGFDKLTEPDETGDAFFKRWKMNDDIIIVLDNYGITFMTEDDW